MLIDQDVLDWLTEDENPAIRYRALTELMDVDPLDERALAAYRRIWDMKAVQKVFLRQREGGVWDSADYGVHTSLRYLTFCAEYGLRRDDRLSSVVDYAVSLLQDKACAQGTDRYDGCSDALLLRALVMLGYHDHPDVRSLIDAYASKMLHDGGFICKRLLDKKPDRRSCYKAAVAGLALYAECARAGVLPDNADRLVQYFLKRNVFYTSDGSALIPDGRPGWRGIDNFFPVESMRIGLVITLFSLCALGAGDEAAVSGAWALLEQKRDERGRFALEGTLSKQPGSFGKVGVPNKWVTLYAALAQKIRDAPVQRAFHIDINPHKNMIY